MICLVRPARAAAHTGLLTAERGCGAGVGVTAADSTVCPVPGEQGTEAFEGRESAASKLFIHGFPQGVAELLSADQWCTCHHKLWLPYVCGCNQPLDSLTGPTVPAESSLSLGLRVSSPRHRMAFKGGSYVHRNHNLTGTGVTCT